MRFLKKVVSALLASVMCIPSGILSFANAMEESTVTTVTLSDTENGFMQFSEDSMQSSTADQSGYHMMQVNDDGELEQVENDGSMWAFNTGDFVEIELIPDNGYNVKSFAIKDSASGDIMASKETMDNIFSFSMPSNSVTVEASFVLAQADAADGKEIVTKGRKLHSETRKYSDEELAALQERINELPDTKEYFDEETRNSIEGNLQEFEGNLQELKEEYFFNLSAEQAEQINAAKLYANLLLMETEITYQEGTKVLNDEQRADLQQRINALEDIWSLVYPNEMPEDDLLFSCFYDDGNVEVDASSAEIDQMFWDTLSLVQEIDQLTIDEIDNKMDTSLVDNMQGFFSTGIATMLDPGMLYQTRATSSWCKDKTEGGITMSGEYDQEFQKDAWTPVKGSYASLEYHSQGNYNDWNMKVKFQSNSDPDKRINYDVVCYCGCAAWNSDRHLAGADGRVHFDKDDVARLLSDRGGPVRISQGHFLKTPSDWASYLGNQAFANADRVKKNKENQWAEKGNGALIRLILWYGEGGPGWGQDGQKKWSYHDAHIALSMAYSGQLAKRNNGTEWEKMYKEMLKIYAKVAPKNLAEFRTSGVVSPGKLNGETVNFEDFQIYMVKPIDTYSEHQHIFFFCAHSEPEPDSDPFMLSIVKRETTKTTGTDTKIAEAKLSGAKYKVEFYKGAAAKTVSDIQKLKKNGKEPTCTWTFTTSTDINKSNDMYKQFLKRVQDTVAEQHGTIVPAGIDFFPKQDLHSDPTKWTNAFLDSNLGTYKQYWGTNGAYYIYEDTAPKGFELGGKYEDRGGKTTGDDMSEGFVVNMSGNLRENNISGKGGGQMFLNGNKISSSTYIEGEKTYGPLIVNSEPPEESKLTSSAKFVDTNGRDYPADSGMVEVKDTIRIVPFPDYNGTYTVKVRLFDKMTNKYVNVDWHPENGDVVDGNAIIHTENINAGDEDARFVVKGAVSSDGMNGHELVFIAEMEYENGSGTKTMEPQKTDKDNKSEQLNFIDNEPGFYTNIISNVVQRKLGTGEAIIPAKGNQTITDTLTYNMFEAGKTYTVKAWLVDKASNTVVDGSLKTGSYKAESASGTWNVDFNIDTSKVKGKTLVAFAEVYDGGTLLYESKDIGNLKETVFIPNVKTKLVDQNTNSNASAKGPTTLVDTVTYTNLLPHSTYRVITTFVNPGTNQVVTTFTKKFYTEDSPNGRWEVKASVDLSSASASGLVCYEEIQMETGDEGSGNWVSVAEHKDPTDKDQQVNIPGGSTTALDLKTNHHVSYAEKYVIINDIVHYEKLQPNKDYVIISTLVDRDTGEVAYSQGEALQRTTEFTTEENFEYGQYINNKPYYGDIYSDLDGDLSGVWTSDGKFKGEFQGQATYVKEGYAYGDVVPGHNHDGVTFKFDATGFEGRTLVVFEEIYKKADDGSLSLVASEMDLTNENQTIHFPKIRTNAIDSKTQTSVTHAGDGISTIVDTVSYENVIPGLTYVVKGQLIDWVKTMEADTEVVATGADGKPAEVSYTFTPDSSSGTVRVAFDIDTSKYANDLKAYNGAVFVVYEELYVMHRYDGGDALSICADHKDLSDESQTIYIPYIETELLDAKTGLHISYAEKETCMIDTVSYHNCKPGMEFYLSGRLVDMKTGKVVVDSAGNPARIDYQQETADGSGDGTWTLAYNLDASTLAGTTVVAYAEVYVKGGSNPNQDGYTPVATHDDFFDRNERVYIPYIDTTLLDQKTDSHYALAEKDVVLYDTVHYTDIHPGDYEYKFESELRDQATGEIAVDNAGRELSLTTTFKADFDMRDDQFATYGDVIPQNYEGSGITFELDGEYFQDRTLVCYERMYVKGADGEWKIVADHQELLDPDQTVHIGKGWTEAVLISILLSQ